MVEKFSYQQWKTMTLDLNKTKQTMQQLSKLYIIIHEKVKLIMRKCQTSPSYDPIQDCERELGFIKVILQRLANREDDQFLRKVDEGALDKYQKNFHDLIQLLRIAIHTYNSEHGVDVEKLKRITQSKLAKRDEFGLKGELKKSKQRMIRTKSGYRVTSNKMVKQIQSKQQQSDEQDLVPNYRTTTPLPLKDIQTHTKQFNQRKQKLEKIINSHIDRKDFGVNYQKKYTNNKLNEYLNERKQFADLIFSQKQFESIIERNRNRKNEVKIHQRKQPDINKLFPDFNIKTKYLKSQVKQNILRVIFEVKKQLLEQWHKENVLKIKSASEVQTVQKPQHTKLKIKKKNTQTNSSAPTTARNLQTRFQSTNRTIANRTNSMNNLKYDSPKKVKQIWIKDENLIKQQKKAHEMFLNSKMPHYQKN